MKEKKQRRHKISDGNLIFAMLFNTVTGFILFLTICSLLEAFCSRVLGFPEEIGYPAAVAGPLLLLIYKLWYRPEFEGALTGGHPEYGLRLSIPIIAVWLLMPLMFLLTPARFGWPTAVTVGISLAAGFCEEAVFRSYALSTFMRRCRDEKMIPVALIISSSFFGLLHGLNALVGADKGSTSMQIIGAALIGVFLGAVYLRCGNLWPCIIMHALNDMIALTNVSDISEHGVVTGGITWWTWVDTASVLVLAAIAIWMVRPEKRPEIIEIWSKKWTTGEPFKEDTDEASAAEQM